MLGLGSSPPPSDSPEPDEIMSLCTLPYDLLLNIASRLDLRDIHALHLTCKRLYYFTFTRPVYKHVAIDLLRRCRALPLKGFQRISDLSTSQLIRSVNKASRYEHAWRRRGPRPIALESYGGVNPHSNYMDSANGYGISGEESSGWYKVVKAPPGEDVDWLSPITSSYTLCATKSGKVVCWDVQTDECLAEWNPGERWELWKCRVEFEEKTVYFTMAKILNQTYDDSRVMAFTLMKLKFYDTPSGESSPMPPEFLYVTDFNTSGVVMNVFLLDPIARLLSAFVWVSRTHTIGLYALLDWDKREYVFIDTGIECVSSANWSCILHNRNIVIHCEGSDSAFQYFYPLKLLRSYVKKLSPGNDTPSISYAVSPAQVLSKNFIFPPSAPTDTADGGDNAPAPSSTNGTTNGVNGHSNAPTTATANSPSTSQPTANPSTPAITNPYPLPQWTPDSAHFVRQWWPSLPGVPKVSCTVVLLSSHDQDTHRTKFILAQHYFRVPLDQQAFNENAVVSQLSHKLIGQKHQLSQADDSDDDEAGPSSSSSSSSRSGGSSASKSDGKSPEPSQTESNSGASSAVNDESLMHLWYVSTPFEVVCVMDTSEEDDGDEGTDRPRPLVAVDFGHAVWIEFVDNEDDSSRPRANDTEEKWLRFVTFPPFGEDLESSGEGGKPWAKSGGEVRTLEVPDELDLDSVETINIDQSQGAVILSVRDGKIFILCYE